MKIIDCQVHIEKGCEKYDLKVDGRNVIFNTVADYKAHRSKTTKTDSVSLVLDFKKDLEFVRHEIASSRAVALKVHSRVQQLSKEDYKPLKAALATFPSHIPVIIDAFYWGHDLNHQPSMEAIVDIAVSDPKRTVVVAHGGGYEVAKYYVHLRKLANVHHDLSLSLQYYEDSSLLMDFKKLIKWTDKKKLMFGSDFPDFSPKKQFDLLMRICDELKISSGDQESIFSGNAAELYGIQI